jgi:hypothetical protein
MIKYICKHCLSVQYLGAKLKQIAHRILCRVCGNPLEHKENDND